VRTGRAWAPSTTLEWADVRVVLLLLLPQAASGPFNFPCMIVLWSLPIALACGNGYVLKPSDRCPTTGARVAELFVSAGLPPGLLAVVHVRERKGERKRAPVLCCASCFIALVFTFPIVCG
jgi:hypothetical protein